MYPSFVLVRSTAQAFPLCTGLFTGLGRPGSPVDLYLYIQDSRLLYYIIREIKTWLNINHITVHSNTYFIF